MNIIEVKSPPGSGVLHILKAGVEAFGQTHNFIDMNTMDALAINSLPEVDVYFVRTGSITVKLPAKRTIFLLSDI